MDDTKTMVDPRLMKQKGLDALVTVRVSLELKQYLLDHGVDLSKVCRDALTRVYQELLVQKGPKRK